MSNNARSHRGTMAPLTMVAAAMAALAVCGCSDSVKLCPVSGKVSVNGKPAGGVYVVFHRLHDAEKKHSPDAFRTNPDGTFSASVRGPGEYAVTAFWPATIEEKGEVIEGDDRFKGKHRKVDQPILKVNIQEEGNPLPPILLKSP